MQKIMEDALARKQASVAAQSAPLHTASAPAAHLPAGVGASPTSPEVNAALEVAATLAAGQRPPHERKAYFQAMMAKVQGKRLSAPQIPAPPPPAEHAGHSTEEAPPWAQDMSAEHVIADLDPQQEQATGGSAVPRDLPASAQDTFLAVLQCGAYQSIVTPLRKDATTESGFQSVQDTINELCGGAGRQEAKASLPVPIMVTPSESKGIYYVAHTDILVCIDKTYITKEQKPEPGKEAKPRVEGEVIPGQLLGTALYNICNCQELSFIQAYALQQLTAIITSGDPASSSSNIFFQRPVQPKGIHKQTQRRCVQGTPFEISTVRLDVSPANLPPCVSTRSSYRKCLCARNSCLTASFCKAQCCSSQCMLPRRCEFHNKLQLTQLWTCRGKTRLQGTCAIVWFRSSPSAAAHVVLVVPVNTKSRDLMGGAHHPLSTCFPYGRALAHCLLAFSGQNLLVSQQAPVSPSIPLLAEGVSTSPVVPMPGFSPCSMGML